MDGLLRAVLMLASVSFLIFVLAMIRRERFLLKYSFIWLILGIAGVAAAIFPGWVFALASFLGFETPSNFLLFVCVFFLMAVSLALCAIVSRQQKRITMLIQELSIDRADWKTENGD